MAQMADNIHWSDLKLEKLIGFGGFGDIHKATWKDKYVAVKKFRDNVKENIIEKEVVNLSSVNHEHIVTLYGCPKDDNERIVMVMEYADCGSLNDILHEKKTTNVKNIPEFQKIDWMLQCAKGIEYLHDLCPKILHRDIKPKNMLLFNQYKLLKLCDFGTVRKLSTKMTIEVGTAPYMAPELDNIHSYTESCDVYSFGITFWEVLSGKKPFYHLTNSVFYHLRRKVSEGNRPNVNDIQKFCDSDQIIELIENCWNGDSKKRPEIQTVIEELLLLEVYNKNLTVKPNSAEYYPRGPGSCWDEDIEYATEMGSSLRDLSLASYIPQRYPNMTQFEPMWKDDELNFKIFGREESWDSTKKAQMPGHVNWKDNELNFKTFEGRDEGWHSTKEAQMPEFNIKWKDIVLEKPAIGFGTFSEVYKAKWKTEGVEKTIAAKKLRYELNFHQHLKREFENLARLTHSNIVACYGISKDDNNMFYILLEHAECGSLHNYLHGEKHKDQDISYKDKISLMRQCAKGIAFLHEKNVIHRDLSTRNMLLFDNFRILKLCDFGTVKANASIMTGGLGTVYYMAPEVIVGGLYDTKCDVYSYGIIFWEVMSRKTPYYHLGDILPLVLLDRIKEGEPPFLGDCEDYENLDHIKSIITQCWDPEPIKRPAMEELLLSLEKDPVCVHCNNII